MSLFGALNIGTSGMQAQSTALSVDSNNISNVNTVGYKEGISNFEQLISDNSASNYSANKNGNGSPSAGYDPYGVLSTTSYRNSLQGEVVAGTSTTNVAISGNGFFAVSPTATAGSNGVLYTRAGSFTSDKNGNLVNTAGYFLQGWPVNPNGTLAAGLTGTVSASAGIAALQPVNIQQLSAIPVATTSVAVKANLPETETIAPVNVAVVANLQSTQAIYAGPPAYNAQSSTGNMASGSVTPQFSSPFTITDSTGVVHNVNVGYLKTGGDQWSVEVYAQPATDVSGANGLIASGTLQFNPDGTLSSISTGLSSVSAAWQDGADPSNLAFNWGKIGTTNGVSELPAASSVTSVTVQPYDATKVTADMASGAVPPQFSSPITVVDSTGATHTLNADFLKTGTNTWAIELVSSPATDVTAAGGQVAAGTVTFNGDGTLASVSPTLTNVSASWTNGAASSTLAINWGTAGQLFGTPGATVIGRSDGLTQVASTFSQNITANGTPASSLTSVAITADGYVAATYKNGVTQNLYKIPLANFVNPDQLTNLSGDVFTASSTSAPPDFLLPGQSGAGNLEPGDVESSNVDLGQQLTNLIVAQRSYQFNSKIASTTDTMLQDLNTLGAT